MRTRRCILFALFCSILPLDGEIANLIFFPPEFCSFLFSRTDSAIYSDTAKFAWKADSLRNQGKYRYGDLFFRNDTAGTVLFSDDSLLVFYYDGNNYYGINSVYKADNNRNVYNYWGKAVNLGTGDAVSGYFIAESLGNNNKYGIYGLARGYNALSSSKSVTGVYGSAAGTGTSTFQQFGVYGFAGSGGIGKKYGVFGKSEEFSITRGNADTIFGVYGLASAANGRKTVSFGGYFKDIGLEDDNDTCYGIYATASGGACNYAGYFAGNAYCDSLTVVKISSTIDGHAPVKRITSGMTKYYASINDAIDDATNGDLIELTPGVYNEAIDPNGKKLTFWLHNGVTIQAHSTATVRADDADTLAFIGAGTITNTSEWSYPETTLVINAASVCVTMKGISLCSDTNTALGIYQGRLEFAGEVQRKKDRYSDRAVISISGGVINGQGNIQSLTRNENQVAFNQTGGVLNWSADIINGRENKFKDGIAYIVAKVFTDGPSAGNCMIYLQGTQKMTLITDSLYTLSGSGHCVHDSNTAYLWFKSKCYKNDIIVYDNARVEVWDTYGISQPWIYLNDSTTTVRVHNSTLITNKYNAGGTHVFEIRAAGANEGKYGGKLELYNSTFITGLDEPSYVGSVLDARGKYNIKAYNCSFINYGGSAYYQRCVSLGDTMGGSSEWQKCSFLYRDTTTAKRGVAFELALAKEGKQFNHKFVDCFFYGTSTCLSINDDASRILYDHDTLVLLNPTFFNPLATGSLYQYITANNAGSTISDSIAQYSKNFAYTSCFGKQGFYGETYMQSAKIDTSDIKKISSTSGFVDCYANWRYHGYIFGASNEFGSNGSIIMKLGDADPSTRWRLYDNNQNQLMDIMASEVQVIRIPFYYVDGNNESKTCMDSTQFYFQSEGIKYFLTNKDSTKIRNNIMISDNKIRCSSDSIACKVSFSNENRKAIYIPGIATADIVLLTADTPCIVTDSLKTDSLILRTWYISTLSAFASYNFTGKIDYFVMRK
jgi:hypothetical protein